MKAAPTTAREAQAQVAGVVGGQVDHQRQAQARQRQAGQGEAAITPVDRPAASALPTPARSSICGVRRRRRARGPARSRLAGDFRPHAVFLRMQFRVISAPKSSAKKIWRISMSVLALRCGRSAAMAIASSRKRPG